MPLYRYISKRIGVGRRATRDVNPELPSLEDDLVEIALHRHGRFGRLSRTLDRVDRHGLVELNRLAEEGRVLGVRGLDLELPPSVIVLYLRGVLRFKRLQESLATDYGAGRCTATSTVICSGFGIYPEVLNPSPWLSSAYRVSETLSNG